MRRLSALDALARKLVEIGTRQSPTINRLLETLDRSDVIVLVETTRVLDHPAELHFHGCVGGWRRVLITIRRPAFERDGAAWLGHELQHAVEIAQAPWVRDAKAVDCLYKPAS